MISIILASCSLILSCVLSILDWAHPVILKFWLLYFSYLKFPFSFSNLFFFFAKTYPGHFGYNVMILWILLKSSVLVASVKTVLVGERRALTLTVGWGWASRLPTQPPPTPLWLGRWGILSTECMSGGQNPGSAVGLQWHPGVWMEVEAPRGLSQWSMYTTTRRWWKSRLPIKWGGCGAAGYH